MRRIESRHKPFLFILSFIISMSIPFIVLNCSYRTGGDDGGEVFLPSDEWEPSSTGYQKRIYLQFKNKNQATALQDFPVLVVLNSSRIDYAETLDDGRDIKFVDAGNGSILPHEVDEWNESGTSYVWVKAPEITGASNTDYIWMYYHYDLAPDIQDPDALWSDYKLVFHFNDDTADATIEDSTVNDNDGTSNTNPPEFVDGQIGNGARVFDDSIATEDRYVTTGYTEPALASYTVEVWVKGDAGPDVSSGNNGPLMGHRIYSLCWNHSDSNYWGTLQFNDGNWSSTSFGTTVGSTWYYWAGVCDDTDIKAYTNGELMSTAPKEGTFTGQSFVYIGCDSSMQPMDGIVDEVRISGQVRSEDFIKAQYLSMTDAFIIYGDSEQIP